MSNIKVDDFMLGTGENSEAAQRILYNAKQKKWANDDLLMYYHSVIRFLAAGMSAEEAILQTDFILITTNIKE